MFNVTSFHHRDVSLCNFGMVSRFPELPAYAGLEPPSVEIIADGVHLHPMAVQAVLAARDGGSVACVTDSVLPPTPGLRKQYNGRTLVVSPDAKYVTFYNFQPLLHSYALIDMVGSTLARSHIPA